MRFSSPSKISSTHSGSNRHFRFRIRFFDIINHSLYNINLKYICFKTDELMANLLY